MKLKLLEKRWVLGRVVRCRRFCTADARQNAIAAEFCPDESRRAASHSIPIPVITLTWASVLRLAKMTDQTENTQNKEVKYPLRE